MSFEKSVTIASYKIWKTWLQVGVVATVFLLVPVGTVWLFADGYFDFGARLGRGFYYLPFILLAWFFMIREFPNLIGIIKQLIFGSGRAVWIENETLFVTGANTFSLACANVLEVRSAVMRRGNLDAISLKLRSGEEKTFPTGAFREAKEIIITRLKELLRV